MSCAGGSLFITVGAKIVIVADQTFVTASTKVAFQTRITADTFMATHYFSLRGRVQILSHSCVAHAHTQARYLGTLFRMLLLLLVFPPVYCVWSSCFFPAGPPAHGQCVTQQIQRPLTQTLLGSFHLLPTNAARYWCLPVWDPGVNFSTLFTLHSGAFILRLSAATPTAFPTTESKNDFCHTQATIHRQTPPKKIQNFGLQIYLNNRIDIPRDAGQICERFCSKIEHARWIETREKLNYNNSRIG